MPLLTVTEAAKAAGVSRTTLYEKIKGGELSRNADKQIDTADLLRVFGELRTEDSKQTPTEHVQPESTMSTELLDMVQAKDAELNDLRSKLDDTERRLNEQREAARALMSPEDFDAKVAKVLEKNNAEHDAKAKQWKMELISRQAEIKQAREEAERISEQAVTDIAIVERRAANERAIREALESRGFLDRLLNRKPAIVG